MRPVNDELKNLKATLETAIRTHDYKMLREPVEGEDAGAMVRPKVLVGNIPHDNFSLYGDEGHLFQAPYILVGYEKSNYDENEESLDVLIQACAYTQEEYGGDDDGQTFPDSMGAMDVTALLEAVKTWLQTEGQPSVSGPFELGTYCSRAFTYPYAFGYLKFTVETGIGTPHNPRLFDDYE